MTYLVHDLLLDSFIGPFPSQDQAMSYAETSESPNIHVNPKRRYTVRRMMTPAYMPARIHGEG